MTDAPMPFGKHKGRPIKKVPRGYAKWCLRELDLSPMLRSQLDALVSGQPIPPMPLAHSDSWYLSDEVIAAVYHVVRPYDIGRPELQ